MQYRADIDGLRAIAILFVLFFHAGLQLFPAGFIGVDIFFVISGFLITGILRDALQNDRFSFIDFYSRRLWRLQPVFICLIFLSTILALLFFLPEDLLLFIKSARKTTLFMANQYFEGVTTGYFAADISQLPLIHSWSLSVEWQCYLILPLLIYGLYRFFRKHATFIIYFLTLLFFAVALYASYFYPDKTYYHLESRLFEFFIGSCIVLMPRRDFFNKKLVNGVSVLALLTLLYLSTCKTIHVGFPNFYAFILCLSTGILILAGEQHPKPWVTQWLSKKPLVFIGLISYSLYIWHWPFLVLLRYQNVAETPFVLFSAFCLIFGLATLSWRFIEKPTRQFHRIKFGYTLLILLILPISVSYVNDFLIKKNEGYPARFPQVVKIYEQLKQYTRVERSFCLAQKNTKISSRCVLGAIKPSRQQGFMIGDSFSNHSWGFMDTLAQDANLSILAHATIACLTLPGIYQYDWYEKNAIYKECYLQTKRYFKRIKSNHYDYVIIGQNWNGYLGDKILHHLGDPRSEELSKTRIATALERALQIIIATGAKPVLIKSIAFTEANLHDCFFKQIKQQGKYRPTACNFNLEVSKDQWINALMVKMKKKYTSLIILDPKKVQCSKGRCRAAINGIPIFRDKEHLTDYASYHLAKNYLHRFKNPLV